MAGFDGFWFILSICRIRAGHESGSLTVHPPRRIAEDLGADFGVAGTRLGYLLYLSISEVNFGHLLYVDNFDPTQGGDREKIQDITLVS